MLQYTAGRRRSPSPLTSAGRNQRCGRPARRAVPRPRCFSATLETGSLSTGCRFRMATFSSAVRLSVHASRIQVRHLLQTEPMTSLRHDHSPAGCPHSHPEAQPALEIFNLFMLATLDTISSSLHRAYQRQRRFEGRVPGQSDVRKSLACFGEPLVRFFRGEHDSG